MGGLSETKSGKQATHQNNNNNSNNNNNKTWLRKCVLFFLLFISRPLRWKQKTTRQKQIGVYVLSCIWVAWLQTTSTAFTFLSITKITNPVLGKRKHAKCRFDTGRADWSAKSIHTSNDNCFPWLWEIQHSLPVFLCFIHYFSVFASSILIAVAVVAFLFCCSVDYLTIFLSTTVVLARWATVDWSCGVRELISTLKKRRLGLNHQQISLRPIPPDTRMREKSTTTAFQWECCSTRVSILSCSSWMCTMNVISLVMF